MIGSLIARSMCHVNHIYNVLQILVCSQGKQRDGASPVEKRGLLYLLRLGSECNEVGEGKNLNKMGCDMVTFCRFLLAVRNVTIR
jgi:hypothetical protein